MRRTITGMAVLTAVFVATSCAAPPPPPPPVDLDTTIASTRALHDTVIGHITASAALVPEDMYSFQPTPDVRTMGQLFGHIAGASVMFCSMAAGLDPPADAPADPESLATKAELEAALAGAFAYCESAYAAISSENGGETMDVFGTEYSRVGALGFNNIHNWEHYGNLVTYMRINGIVPPSSAGM